MADGAAAPDTSSAATPPLAAGNGSEQDSAGQWQQAAASATPAPEAGAPPQGYQGPGMGAGAAAAPPAAPPPAVVITPLKPGGLAGVIQGMADVLSGTTRPDLAKGSDGQTYVKDPANQQWRPVSADDKQPSQGREWLTAGARALTGAAKGWAAGKGNNPGAAAAAGVDQGVKFGEQDQQRQKDMSDEARQQNLEQANAQMLRMNFAEKQMALARMGTQASQEEMEFWQKQGDRLESKGGKFLGTMASPNQLRNILKVDPDVMQHMIQDHTVEMVKAIGEDGKSEGFTAYLMPNQHRNEMLGPGQEGLQFDPQTGEMVKFNYTDPISTGQLLDNELAEYGRQADFQIKQENLKKTQAETAASNATVSKTPSEIRKNNAEATNAQSEAQLHAAQQKKVESGAVNPDGTPNPRFEALAQAVYDGDILPADLKREAKGSGLDPNEVMGRATEIGQQRGKPFSSSIIEQEHKFASNTKTQAALDGIDRIIGKPGQEGVGYMNQMLDLAQKANLGTNGAFNSADLAVRRTFGEESAKNFNTAVSETRRSIAGLIGNPVLGGSDSDKKLAQADEMLGDKPTMENLKGAAAILKTALETQRTSMVDNNRFLAKRYGGAAAQPTQPKGITLVQPGEPTAKSATGETLVVRNGQWVPAKTQ
jgi:hypothetical protein